MKKVLAVILSIILTMSCTSNVIASSTFNIATSPLLGDTSTSASVASDNTILINKNNNFRVRVCPDSVYTPNGTDVYDYSITQCNYNVVSYIDNLPDHEKIATANYWGNRYPDATYISEATYSYNCHSYAWYSQNSSTNTYWINYPTAYYHASDMSYTMEDTPRIGDIICYYDLDLPSNEQNIHSGIVVGFTGETSNNDCGNSNTVIVQSKWGPAPLYEHKGDECPYVQEYGADEVRYYRPNTNASYTLSSSMNNLSISRTINGNGSITDTYGMYELNVTNAGKYTITIQSDDALSNRLYNANMNLMSMISSSSGTGNYTYVADLSAGRYYLRTAYTDTTNSGTISITIEPHEHIYDSWKYYNSELHIQCCICGKLNSEAEPETGQHYVYASEIVNYMANCKACGHLLDLRSDSAISIMSNAVRVSVNGSYILPGGIIVLVDEDVEAYLNGTLVFYNRDDLPVTQ